MRSYVVHVGYTETGKSKNRYFATMEHAVIFVGKVFKRTGIVLSIVESKSR